MQKKLIVTAMLIAHTLIASCGGGGGGGSNSGTASNNSTSQNASDFIPNQFLPAANFRSLCINPQPGESQGDFIDENNWLRSTSNNLYLWYNDIADVDPGSEQDPLDYFDLLRTFALSASGSPQDRFHSAIATDEFREFVESGGSAGYGATFAVIADEPPREIIVAFNDPGSPATLPSINLERGVKILEIDGIDLINTTIPSEIDQLNAGLFPVDINETHTFVVQDPGSTDSRVVSITSAQTIAAPVRNVQVLDTPSGNVGYILFNDHIAPAEIALINAIEQLQTFAITDLILDLRYNGGGFLDIANSLAFMIAGENGSGKTFETLQFNDKHPVINPVTGEQLNPIIFNESSDGRFSAPAGTPYPQLNLSRVFVLTSADTCSASESLINGLRGVDLEVIQIGTTTCGKPYGFYALDNCGTTYLTIQFRGVNAKNFGDYSDGFTPSAISSPSDSPALLAELPGCIIMDDFSHALGDPQEALLQTALAYQQNGACPAPALSRARQTQAVNQHTKLSVVDPRLLKPAWQQGKIVTAAKNTQ
ncbi:MAG: hypothetical protein KUG79_16375 [Pseudomonadales bacterium]|nr:hypothetical protein [Pseudomonadales bacterium]